MSYRFASLSSGLLARKGAAQPAMASHAGGNPRFFNDEPVEPPAPVEAAAPRAVDILPPSPPPAAPDRHAGILAQKPEANAPLFPPAAKLARAGFSFESAPPPPSATPRPEAFTSPLPPRGTEQGGGCGQPAAACSVANAANGDPARRFHVSVRLKQSHFVRLKIASAQLRKPSQDIIGEALTAYFRTLDPNVFGDCACAAE
ncbi:MAG: hypothetical protein QM698_05235 [Micropepsaceae bacterium]